MRMHGAQLALARVHYLEYPPRALVRHVIINVMGFRVLHSSAAQGWMSVPESGVGVAEVTAGVRGCS